VALRPEEDTRFTFPARCVLLLSGVPGGCFLVLGAFGGGELGRLNISRCGRGDTTCCCPTPPRLSLSSLGKKARFMVVVSINSTTSKVTSLFQQDVVPSSMAKHPCCQDTHCVPFGEHKFKPELTLRDFYRTISPGLRSIKRYITFHLTMHVFFS
jgi:hypothetical protein